MESLSSSQVWETSVRLPIGPGQSCYGYLSPENKRESRVQDVQPMRGQFGVVYVHGLRIMFNMLGHPESKSSKSLTWAKDSRTRSIQKSASILSRRFWGQRRWMAFWRFHEMEPGQEPNSMGFQECSFMFHTATASGHLQSFCLNQLPTSALLTDAPHVTGTQYILKMADLGFLLNSHCWVIWARLFNLNQYFVWCVYMCMNTD